MLKEFRNFIARGNVLDLAVAVIMGTAFGAINIMKKPELKKEAPAPTPADVQLLGEIRDLLKSQARK